MSEPPESARAVQGPVVVGKAYDLVLWLVQKVEKFPKSYRFSVGQRLIDTGLDLLLLLVDAAYRKDKREALRTAGLRTNALRFLLRLARDLRLLSESTYAFANERLDEVGRMVGGWERAAGRAP
jgi:hypothetical protein